MFQATTSRSPFGPLLRRAQYGLTALLLMLSMLLVAGAQDAQAAPKPAKDKNTSISVIPTITNIRIVNGGLVADGVATTVIKGQTTTTSFANVPLNIKLAENQAAAVLAGCPILDLELGPINLNVLGLVVQTSPICLTVTAYQGGGLLGSLLCSVAHLLDGGLRLDQILAGQGTSLLPGLTTVQLNSLTTELTNLFNQALNELAQAVLTAINIVNRRGTCAILHLELGPLELNLLGLVVELDNCNNGPVTVDITGRTGRGNLLGNLLCQLLGSGALNLGLTLQQILGLIGGLLA